MIRISSRVRVHKAVEMAQRLGCDLVLKAGEAYLRPRRENRQ